MQLTGQLAASISTKAGNDFVRIGSNKPYAAIHHLGGNADHGRKVSLPARTYP
ncbi:phage virion morphogenesis protein [Neisseria sp.]|uniref:phage virion morphogenesis protein n=1 Tax=Neisseria sp. TaxID=192066 RepID=UPI00359FB630